MIRRDQLLPDGSPGWVLISQPRHAVLAGELAAAWGSPAVAPLWPRETVVETVRRHDDGWAAWEASPEIDPVHGRPYSFLEMPHPAAQAIWEASIAGVADLGPLAQYMVAMHFVTLRRRAAASHGVPEGDFARDYGARASKWLREWQGLSPENTAERAGRALAHLQMFDALSLWLCCHAQPQATSFPTPDGPDVRFSPREGMGSVLSIEVDPWPFRTEEVATNVSGRQFPVRAYASAEQLAAAASPITLRWMFRPR